MTRTDRYALTQSKEFHLKSNEEARIDLRLKKDPVPPDTKITGIVTSNGIPVPDATVKILDPEFNPVTHTVTDRNGAYVIEDLKPGRYKMTATAKGFLTARTIEFTVKEKETKKINIEIKEDKISQRNGYIYGTVNDWNAGDIIKNAFVKLTPSGSARPFATTSSNDFGQYLFCAVPPGEYYAAASKPGYFPGDKVLFAVSEGQFVKIPLLLRSNTLSAGTVSGMISEPYFEAFAGVCVGLFMMDKDSETLVQMKMTNSEGLYLFSDVQPGIYVVKAKIEGKWESLKTFSIKSTDH